MQWRRPTGLSRSGGPSRQDAEIIALFRLKTLLLAFESLSLTVLLFHIPSLRTALSAGLRPVLWTVVALAGLGAVIQMVALLSRLVRLSRLSELLSRYPYGRYLLLTQTAFLAGTWSGAALMEVSMEQFGMLLCLCMALCATLTALFLLPAGASPKGSDMGLWGSLYLALSDLGGLIGLEGENWRASLLSFFRTSAALSPLWSLGLFLALGGWLLRPFSWRHVFDRRLPRRFRGVLGFTMASAALPLGGLAIPFWIYARHKIWPFYERYL